MNRAAVEKIIIKNGFTPIFIKNGRGAVTLVVPELQGRVLATWLGEELVTYLNINDLAEPETARVFNNYGGQDRFWIGPEAGEFGFFMKEGMPSAGEHWRAPRDLNLGGFAADGLLLKREIHLTNAKNIDFHISVERKIEIINENAAARILRKPIPPDCNYSAVATINSVRNIGKHAWTEENGLPFIWILGQFPVSPNAYVCAPFVSGGDGPVYNDLYFGKIPADRIGIGGGNIIMRADGAKVTKFGVPANRCAGRAFARDPDRGIAYYTFFDSDPNGRYVNNLWNASANSQFGGDVFQSYNSGDGSFFELESVSPGLGLKPGEEATHRHGTLLMRLH